VTAGSPGSSYGMSITDAVATSDGGVVFGGLFSGQMTLAGESFSRMGNTNTKLFAKVDSVGDWVYAHSSDTWS
jgi:hypothetical protein